MLGISVYISDINEVYLRAASALKVKYIFTSLHIPEENFTNFDDNLKSLLLLSSELDLSIIPDISPNTFDKLGIAENDYKGLKEFGFDLVRLDFGFEDLVSVQEIAKYFKIVLNASVVDEAYLDSLSSINLRLDDIYLMHNFYPRSETALSIDYFSKMNKDHKGLKLNSMAFVAGDVYKRLPLYEGLPTLEKHRDQNPFTSAVELRKNHQINTIFIGDNQSSIASLRMISEFLYQGIINIPAYLYEDYTYLYDEELIVRQDMAESLIRLRTSRIANVDIKRNNHRRVGAIVMDNKLAERYSGEISIIKEKMAYSSRSNNIGFVHPDYIDLLEFIDHKEKIKFIRIEEVEKWKFIVRYKVI